MKDTITKAVAIVKDVETTDPNGAFEVVLSAATLDRDGEIVDSKAFEPLPEHISFDIDHGMTVMTTVGSGVPTYNDDGLLVVKGTYASTALAQDVRTLVTEGHVRTTSVTFMAAKREKDEKGVVHVRTAELLNGTFTPVPSNRESVVLSSKSLKQMTEKIGARNSKDDADTLQAAHDLLVELGASCDPVETPDEAEPASDDEKTVARGIVRKAIAGSYQQRESAVYDAVSAAYTDYDQDTWAYPVATFDDNVVFRISGSDNAGTWRAPYTIEDDGTATLGAAEQVVITEVITTVSDSEESADTAADESAADATDPSTAKSTDEESAEMKARAAYLSNEVAFMFGD